MKKNPAVHTRVDVGKSGLEALLSQPAPPPQCLSSPRWSPAIGTRSDEFGVLRAENQSTEREIMFPIQVSMDVFCMSAAQAQSGSVFFFNQTSGETTKKKQLLPNKPLLARSSRDH